MHQALPTRRTSDTYPPGARLQHGRFIVRGLHGVGGMSMVYEAEQRQGWFRSRTVAVKVAQPRLVDPHTLAESKHRLAHEAILLRLVDHWRVPRALALFEEHDRLHLVMEFVPGHTLERLLMTPGSGAQPPWPEESVVALGLALADLLAHLHARPTPILLRDLKPTNLIVTPAGHVMLVDLGIASPLRPGQPIPATERWLGTHGYAAPEQCLGDGREDARVDLYALGAVLFRVATGYDPARTPNHHTFPRARSVYSALSHRLDRLLAALLQPDPACRLASAEVLVAELAHWEPSASPSHATLGREAPISA